MDTEAVPSVHRAERWVPIRPSSVRKRLRGQAEFGPLPSAGGRRGPKAYAGGLSKGSEYEVSLVISVAFSLLDS